MYEMRQLNPSSFCIADHPTSVARLQPGDWQVCVAAVDRTARARTRAPAKGPNAWNHQARARCARQRWVNTYQQNLFSMSFRM